MERSEVNGKMVWVPKVGKHKYAVKVISSKVSAMGSILSSWGTKHMGMWLANAAREARVREGISDEPGYLYRVGQGRSGRKTPLSGERCDQNPRKRARILHRPWS